MDMHRHLSDTNHRETFEPAHSVVLGIFAAHAQKTGEGRTATGSGFVQSLVPFYVGCLIEVRSSFPPSFILQIFILTELTSRTQYLAA